MAGISWFHLEARCSPSSAHHHLSRRTRRNNGLALTGWAVLLCAAENAVLVSVWSRCNDYFLSPYEKKPAEDGP